MVWEKFYDERVKWQNAPRPNHDPAVLKAIPARQVGYKRRTAALVQHAPAGADVVDLRPLFNGLQQLFVSPTQSFKAALAPALFTGAYQNWTDDSEPVDYTQRHGGYWPAQLNFAVWCATAGCGVSRDLLVESNTPLDSYQRTFFRFHVYFTVLRVLSEMDVPLPGNKIFIAGSNHYDVGAYGRIKSEFQCPWGLYSFIVPVRAGDVQYNYFVPNTAAGLFNIARLQQSVIAFALAVVNAQVGEASSILDGEGSPAAVKFVELARKMANPRQLEEEITVRAYTDTVAKILPLVRDIAGGLIKVPASLALPAQFLAPRTETAAEAGPKKAWAKFFAEFPHADKTHFVVENFANEGDFEVFYVIGPHRELSVFASDRSRWSPQMKAALGIAGPTKETPAQPAAEQKKEEHASSFRKVAILAGAAALSLAVFARR